ncbi:CU044_5270 family protein [Streptomyces sp. NPDC006267]|uniref:CU044_5270 family protein n=1 Tax=Streptomyces sp. NPDC006267 TaxID=3157173 RepID=UPI0033A147D1
MIRNSWRWRDEPLDRAELARLLPPPGDPELSSDRLSGLEEHLMTEIRNLTPDAAPDAAPDVPPSGVYGKAHAPRPARGSARRPVLVGVGAALVLAAVAGIAGLNGGAGGPAAAGGAVAPPVPAAPPSGAVPAPVVQVARGSVEGLTGAVDDIAGAAARAELPEPLPGQFLYVRSQVSWMVSWEGVDGKNKSYVDKIHPREVWMSPDGAEGWLMEPYKKGIGRDGVTLDDPGSVEPSLNAPSYHYLRTLPTDPDVLLKKIYDETNGQGNGPDQQAFSTIGDLLREQVLPPELAAGLYRAAARIPGVVLVDDSADAAGRHGVAIARTDEADGARTEWIFDRETYTYLGERTVQTRDVEGVKAGTVRGHTAVTDRAVVDAIKQRPAAPAPVPAPGAGGESAPAAAPSAGT